MHLEASLNRLKDYIEKEGFKGYDPYDTLNSFIPFSKMGKWIPALAIQFQKTKKDLNHVSICFRTQESRQ